MSIREKNIKECLEMCLGFSQDKEFTKKIKAVSHEERVVFLLDNGFTFDLEENEAKELEKMYRAKAKKIEKSRKDGFCICEKNRNGKYGALRCTICKKPVRLI